MILSVSDVVTCSSTMLCYFMEAALKLQPDWSKSVRGSKNMKRAFWCVKQRINQVSHALKRKCETVLCRVKVTKYPKWSKTHVIAIGITLFLNFIQMFYRQYLSSQLYMKSMPSETNLRPSSKYHRYLSRHIIEGLSYNVVILVGQDTCLCK